MKGFLEPNMCTLQFKGGVHKVGLSDITDLNTLLECEVHSTSL